MKLKDMLRKSSVILLSSTLSFAIYADIDSSVDTGSNENVSSTDSSSSNTSLGNIANEYRDFLGDDAELVVKGLREGGEVNLSSTSTGTDGTTSTSSTSFESPAGKMGNGEVSLSLGLAEEQLNQYGITEPTAEELQASLVGGEITTESGGTTQLDGVLTMRSEGMGWGQIAQEYGTKVGHVISSVKSGKVHVMMETESRASMNSAGNGNSGISTAGGDNISGHYGKSKNHSYGRGIVSATGESMGNVGGYGKSSGGNGHAYGRGIVTGGGVTASAGSNSGGNGYGKGGKPR
jgi:hypothetical protein